jgi:hypothetical protein
MAVAVKDGFPSAGKLFRSKRYISVLLIAFAFLSLVSWHAPEFVSISYFDRPDLVPEFQQRAYEISPGTDKPTCPWQDFHDERYHTLRRDRRNVFIAINFYNNQNVLPNFFQEFPMVLRSIGTERIFVSVYENGSEDKTPELLALRTSRDTRINKSATLPLP